MVNEERVRVMTKTAIFEEGVGKKALPTGEYYRSDYLFIQMLKSFFLGKRGIWSDWIAGGVLWNGRTDEQTAVTECATVVYCCVDCLCIVYGCLYGSQLRA
jgi:hypothetical protein